jgi:hypothetical protein
MAVYVGLGVGLRSSSLCIIDELGAVRLERTVASAIEEIAASVRRFATYRAEVGQNSTDDIRHGDPWAWPFDQLQPLLSEQPAIDRQDMAGHHR